MNGMGEGVAEDEPGDGATKEAEGEIVTELMTL
jgi:hypothetical protein